MPNWCSTRMTIENSNKEELKLFYDKIKEWTAKNFKESHFGLDWLGNIVGNSGIGTINTNESTDLPCRGMLTYINLDDNVLNIETQTAWVPMLEMWVKLLDKHLPNARLTYDAEEPGYEIYETNDENIVNTYNIDSHIEEFDSDYQISETECIKRLQSLLKSNSSDIDTLLKELKQSEKYRNNIAVHRWKYSEIDTWC